MAKKKEGLPYLVDVQAFAPEPADDWARLWQYLVEQFSEIREDDEAVIKPTQFDDTIKAVPQRYKLLGYAQAMGVLVDDSSGKFYLSEPLRKRDDQYARTLLRAWLDFESHIAIDVLDKKLLEASELGNALTRLEEQMGALVEQISGKAPTFRQHEQIWQLVTAWHLTLCRNTAPGAAHQILSVRYQLRFLVPHQNRVETKAELVEGLKELREARESLLGRLPSEARNREVVEQNFTQLLYSGPLQRMRFGNDLTDPFSIDLHQERFRSNIISAPIAGSKCWLFKDQCQAEAFVFEHLRGQTCESSTLLSFSAHKIVGCLKNLLRFKKMQTVQFYHGVPSVAMRMGSERQAELAETRLDSEIFADFHQALEEKRLILVPHNLPPAIGGFRLDGLAIAVNWQVTLPLYSEFTETEAITDFRSYLENECHITLPNPKMYSDSWTMNADDLPYLVAIRPQVDTENSAYSYLSRVFDVIVESVDLYTKLSLAEFPKHSDFRYPRHPDYEREMTFSELKEWLLETKREEGDESAELTPADFLAKLHGW